MSKIRIHIAPGEISDSLLISDRDIVHKVKDVLRLKPAEFLYIFDGCGKEYVYSIEALANKSILLKKEKLLQEEPLAVKRVTLAFPLEKEERVDFILQKCTELGVSRFIPFVCQRSIQKTPSANRFIRWRKIINEAARQSQRLWIPSIEETQSFKDICKLDFDLKLAGKLDGKRLTKKIDKKIKDILIIIGPVGDFSLEEYAKLEMKGFSPIKLSPNLLRTETAAIFAVGLVNNFLDASR